MYATLPRAEMWAYWFTWLSAVSYSVYKLYLSGRVFRLREHSEYFVSGWPVLRSIKDTSDYEWLVWTDFLAKASLWLVCHSVGTEVIRWMHKQVIPLWYLLMSVWFLMINFGAQPTLFYVAVPCVTYLLSEGRSRCAVWCFAVAGMLALGFDQVRLPVPEHWRYFCLTSHSWLLIRCISFAVERMNGQSAGTSAQELVTVLAYCLYFPTLFLGPVIGYPEFLVGIQEPFSPWSKQRCMSLVFNCLRFLGWWLFTEVALHFLYSSALIMHPHIVKHLDPWSLYGMGYCMGQFFMLKYVVIYGLTSTVAKAESIKAPRHPKCIARIHLYSDMWRYFDEGLYVFLKRCVYVPCLGSKPGLCRKLAASFMCFCFVFLWHRPYLSIFVWSLLNFVGIAVEKICTTIGRTEVYRLWEDTLLPSQQAKRRFHAIISVPLFLMSALSNFYFFGDVEIGNIFVKRFCEGSLLVSMLMFVFAYCCCQVSIQISIREKKKINNK